MKDNVDVLFQDAGARWRAIQPAPDEPDWSRVTARSKTPIWVAATAAAAVLAIVLSVTFWPAKSGQPPASRPPVIGPLVPTAKGAIVPAPDVVPHNAPVGSYCPARALTGSVVFRSTVGQLRLSERPGITKSCNLPGLLTGSTVPQLVDGTGQVRAVGNDPAARFNANPPYFGTVALQPGQTATMFLRADSGPPCLPGGGHAVIRYLDSELVLPVTGASNCMAGKTSFWYGPFSTPGHAVAFEPVDWTYLSAALHFPATIPAAGAMHFRVTLTNRSRTHSATLAPCPRFGMALVGEQTSTWPQGLLGCPTKAVVIGPGRSHEFTLEYEQQSPLPAGNYTVEWAIPGVASVYGTTTVR